MARPASRHGPWEAWALAGAGIVLVLAWGLFGFQGVVWVIGVPVLVVVSWIMSHVRHPSLHGDEIDADFERIRLDRVRRRRAREAR